MIGYPTISVVIPCRNTERYLAEALRSVRDQSLTPLEVVVVDDGSSDGSAAIAAADPMVRLDRQPPLGIGAARNRGVELARGEVIAFLDADDLWPLDSLMVRMCRLMASPDLDGVYGPTEQFLSPDLPREAAPPTPPPLVMGRLVGAMLLRRHVFDRVGAFDPTLTLGDTLDLVARMDEAGMRMATVEGIVLRRRIHGRNTVMTQRDRQGDYLKVLKAALDRRRAAQRP